MKRLKVLISAYACSPYRGSEPAVGWGFISGLARHHDLWVLVEEEKFRADIERFEASNSPLRGVHFHFIRKRRRRLLRKLWPPSYYWYYREWQQAALDLGRRLHAEVGFDVAHQLTMVGYREPGYLWKLGVPFVWGPVGGLGTFPWRFLGHVGAYGAAYFLGYNLVNLAQARLAPRPRSAAQGAARILFATEENRSLAARIWAVDGEILPEVGLPRLPVEAPCARPPGTPLRLVWSGQHTPGKALNIGLQALAGVSPQVQWSLDVLGSGSQTDRWIRTARRLQVDSRCRFHGWVERDRALSVMEAAHVLLVTSLRDLTSTVTIEAMALGLPIICPDHCGFADAVDARCGIKVPVRSPAQLVADLRAAVERLGRDERGRLDLAWGALARSRSYAWERKVLRMDAVYRAAAGPLGEAQEDASAQ